MQSYARRALVWALSAALILVSPGFPCYQALAAEFTQETSARVVAAPAAGAVSVAPISALPALPTSNIPALNVSAPVSQVQAAPRAAAEAPAPAAASLARGQASPRQAVAALAASVAEQAKSVSDAVAPLSQGRVTGEAASAIGGRIFGEKRRASGLSLRLKRAAATAILGLTLLAPAGLRAQQAAPGVPAPQQTQSQAAAPAQDPNAGQMQVQPGGDQAQDQEPPIVYSNNAAIQLSNDRQGATVGEKLTITVKITNNTDQPATLPGLRTSISDILPQDVEIQSGTQDDGPLALAPHETKTLTFQVIAFNSGELKAEGPLELTFVGP